MLQDSEETGVSSVLLSSTDGQLDRVHYSTMMSPSVPASQLTLLWRRRREFLVVILAGVAYMPLATVIAYSSPALPHLQSEFPGCISPEEGSWFTSLGSLGAGAGTLLGGPLTNRLGRKHALLYSLICLTISWLIVLGWSHRLWILLLGRILTGVTSGTLLVIIPTYVAEISSAEYRGSLQSIATLIYQLGYVFTYTVGAFCDWQWLTVACIVHVIVSTIGVPYIPESPRWLLSRNRHGDAESALMWLRQSSNVKSELDEIRINLQLTGGGYGRRHKMDVRSPRVYKPFLLSLGLMIILVSTGIDVVLFYTVSIFQEVPSTGDTSPTYDPYFQTAIVGATGVVGVIASMFLIDRIGRRPILMLSGALVALFMGLLGTFFKIRETKAVSTDSYSWIPMVCLLGFLISYNIGWGGVPYALSAELLPTEARDLGTGICFTLVWVLGFVWTKCFVVIQEWIGASGMFWIFSVSGGLGVLFTFTLIPETKGKSLEQIGLIFSSR